MTFPGLTNVGTIDGINNQFDSDLNGAKYTPEVREYIDALAAIANEVSGLGDLQKRLIKEFGEGELLEAGNCRLANVVGFEGTIIRRDVSKIILPNGETPMPTVTNMGPEVIDPIAWSSKPAAPSHGYGLLGKVEELRPNHQSFNEALYIEIMNREIRLQGKGIAREHSDQETVIMPIYAIKGADDLISKYSQKPEESDIQTAKHYGINS